MNPTKLSVLLDLFRARPSDILQEKIMSLLPLLHDVDPGAPVSTTTLLEQFVKNGGKLDPKTTTLPDDRPRQIPMPPIPLRIPGPWSLEDLCEITAPVKTESPQE